MNTKKRTIWVLIASVFLAASTAAIALGQTGSGSLSGYITDSQGGRLPGVTVTATSPALIGSAVAVTDGEGYYRVINLPPGTYTITAELQGFATSRHEGILLRAGVNFQVNAELAVAGVSETVTVQAESPMLEVASPSNVLNIEGDFQRELPLQSRRYWSDFLELAPGVISKEFDDGSGRRTYYSHGTMHNAHVTQLDGMMAAGYNDMQLAKIGMPSDLIADTQVKSGGVGASDPTTNAMVMNIITKSGGNSLSGSVTYDLQPFSWNGDNTGEGETPTISKINQLDLSIGGPIVRDRVWFFGAFRYANYEYGISRTEQQVNNLQSYFPDKALFNNTSNAKYPFAKITAKLGNNHVLTGDYQYDRTKLTRMLSYHYDPIRFEQFGGSLLGGKLVSTFGSDVTTNFAASYNNKGGADHGAFGDVGSGPNVVIHPAAFEQAGKVLGTGEDLRGRQRVYSQPGAFLAVHGSRRSDVVQGLSLD